MSFSAKSKAVGPETDLVNESDGSDTGLDKGSRVSGVAGSVLVTFGDGSKVNKKLI
jgi:hypothetical protein